MKTPIELAYETTKQFIALATGILTITITFADKFRISTEVLIVPLVLKWAWICLGAVIFFSVWTLMAITGSAKADDAMGSNIRIPAALMVLSFFAAIVLTIIAGFSVVK